jgi:hypothetical protein
MKNDVTALHDENKALKDKVRISIKSYSLTPFLDQRDDPHALSKDGREQPASEEV